MRHLRILLLLGLTAAVCRSHGVDAAASGPPQIVRHLEAAVLSEGQSHVLSVEATGSPPLSYTWWRNEEVIPDATAPELVLTPATVGDSGRYRVNVANDEGSRGSAARLIVYASLPTGGAVDAHFSGVADGLIHAIAEDRDGRIYFGGNFDAFSGVALSFLVRLNRTGVLDEEFRPALPGQVNALTVQPDGKILAGGIGWITRLTPDGAADKSFFGSLTERADGAIGSIMVQPDGFILVGGSFEHFDADYTGPLVRLKGDGAFAGAKGRYTERPSWFDEYGSMSVRLIPEPTGRVLVSTLLLPGWMGSSQSIDRLLSDGSLDASFESRTYGKFHPVAVLPQLYDGEVAGYWVVDAYQVFLQRLGADGGQVEEFQTFEIGRPVEDAALDPQGRLYLLIRDGYGEPAHLYRFDRDGQFDPTFRNEAKFIRPGAVQVLASNEIIISDYYGGQSHVLRIFGDNPITAFSDWAERYGSNDPYHDAGARGIPALLRYAFGMDAVNPELKFLPTPLVVRDGEGDPENYLAITFRRRDEAEDLLYTVEASNDLANWKELGDGANVVSATPPESGIRTVTIRDIAALESQRARFLRLKVSLVAGGDGLSRQ